MSKVIRVLGKIMAYIGVFIAVVVIGFVANLILTNDSSMNIDWNDSVGTVQEDIVYGDQEANKYDLYLPADTSKQSYGLVVYLHAGGFTSGDKRDDANILQWFTSKGYVAAGINYTLKTDSNSASIFSMSNEIKAAVPQVVAKAKELGYNVDRMAMAGGSAGGGLAALYTYRDGKDAPVPIKFLWATVFPSSFEVDTTSTDPQSAAAFLSVLAGKTITAEMINDGSYKEALRPIESASWVDENSPPSLVAFGKYDRVMPFSVEPLRDAYAKYNVPNDFIVFEHSGHGLHRDRDKQKLLMQKLNEYLDQYLSMPL